MKKREDDDAKRNGGSWLLEMFIYEIPHKDIKRKIEERLKSEEIKKIKEVVDV